MKHRSEGRSDLCPVSVGEDSAVNFALVVFVLDLAYSSWLAACLAFAARRHRKVLWLAPWVEIAALVVLAVLAYSSSVSISTLHTSSQRLAPAKCVLGDTNYQKLSAGVALSWLLFVIALVTRLCTRVHALVHGLAVGTPKKTDEIPSRGGSDEPFIELPRPSATATNTNGGRKSPSGSQQGNAAI